MYEPANSAKPQKTLIVVQLKINFVWQMPVHTHTDYFLTDTAFDSLYPIYIRNLSEMHWTPLHIARAAAHFLSAPPNARIIDIGAGAGKFCIAAAHFTKGTYHGIEQRRNFVQAGNKVIARFGITNAHLIHGNFTDIDLTIYSGIYFYNSFHENIVLEDSLDDKIERSSELYDLYTQHLLSQLRAMPTGTRLATYWLSVAEIPACYKLCATFHNDLLKLWIKEY